MEARDACERSEVLTTTPVPVEVTDISFIVTVNCVLFWNIELISPTLPPTTYCTPAKVET